MAIGLTAVAQFWVTAASPLTVDTKPSERGGIGIVGGLKKSPGVKAARLKLLGVKRELRYRRFLVKDIPQQLEWRMDRLLG
jgi:hypothetical protein